MLQDHPEIRDTEENVTKNDSPSPGVEPEPESAGRVGGLSESVDYDASPSDVPPGRKSASADTVERWRDFADINYAVTFDELKQGFEEILGENFRLAPSGKVKSGKRRWVEDEKGRRYFGATTNRDLLLQIIEHFERAGPAAILKFPRTEDIFRAGAEEIKIMQKPLERHLEKLHHLPPPERWRRFLREEKSVPVEIFHTAMEELLGSGFTLELSSHDPKALRMVRDSSGHIVAQDRTNHGLLEKIIDHALEPGIHDRASCNVQGPAPEVAEHRLEELIPPTERSMRQYGDRIPGREEHDRRQREAEPATKRLDRERMRTVVRDRMGREYEFFQKSGRERGVRHRDGSVVLTAKTNKELLSKVIERAKERQEGAPGERIHSELIRELRSQKKIHEHKLNQLLQSFRDNLVALDADSRVQVEVDEDGRLELKIVLEV